MEYQKAIDALYDTVFEPENWRNTAIECAKLVNGATLFLLVADTRTGEVNVVAGHGLECLGLPAYESYYHKVDIWAQGLQHSAHGRIHLYHEIVDQARYENSEVFADWVKPGAGYDVFWGVGGALPLWDERHIAFLASHRSRRQGEMNAADRAALQALVPHVQRVLQLRRFVESHEARSSGLEAMCDASGVATLLVDEHGRVAHANRPAVELLRRNDGVRLRRDGVLVAAIASEDQCLHRQIAAACGVATMRAKDFDGPLRITRHDGTRPLIVSVGPVPTERFSMAGRRAIVFVEDVWATHPASAEKIALVFGVTPAEARLVAALSEGRTLMDAVHRLGISYNTGRAQLRSVLSKTGIRRQSELMLHTARLR